MLFPRNSKLIKKCYFQGRKKNLIFLVIPMGAIRYAKEIRLLGKFQPGSFKTERLVCVETDGQTDMARSSSLVMLINNIYILWGWKCILHCVANF